MGYTTMWVLLFIAFIIAEVATSISLVSIWFCLGAVAAIFAAQAGVAFVWQFSIFVVVSAAFLILTKPFVQKFKPKDHATNLDAIIGGVAVVVETINNLEEKGQVKIDGKYWSARSVDDSIIEEKEKVTVVKIQGVRALVKKL